MKRKILFALMLGLSAAFTFASAALAQSGELRLVISKRMGFALGNQIQGTFEAAVTGPGDIAEVTYEIDGRPMGTVTAAPFRFSFNTEKYAPGPHTFTATARTTGGQVYKSNAITAEIITLSAGWQELARTFGPLVIIVLLAIGLGVGLQFLPQINRRYEPGAAREYGTAGGAICPRCHRPFALSWLSPHLLGRRFQRCPYCGRWGFVSRESSQALKAAEQAELEAATPQVQPVDAEERLRQQIEASRYQ